MNHNAALEDSMAPDRLVQITRVERTSLDLQLSINQRLMDRLAVLEKKVKDLELMQSA